MPTAQTLNEWSWERARLTWPYDPIPVLKSLNRPILAIWGAEDNEFIPRIHRPLFEQAMRTARNKDYSVRVIPGADHSLRSVAASFVDVPGYAPAYFQTMFEWLKRTAIKEKRD